MKFINLGLEEETSEIEPVDLNPNETEKAAQAVENQDSTETSKVLQVANYKEELAIINAKNKTEEGATDGEEEPAADSSSDNDEASDSSDDAPTEDDTDDTDEEANNSDDDTDDTDEEANNSDDDSDDAEEVVKPDSEVAQENYFAQGYKMAVEALQSMEEMAKYHTMLKKRSKLSGINPKTATVISESLKRNSEICGYEIKVPAIESYSTISGSNKSTEDLTIAIEGFLNSIWEAIKRFFKSIWKWIMDLLSKKKSESSPSNPQTPQDRDKAVDELNKKLDILIEDTKKKDKLRKKDSANGKAGDESDKKMLVSSIADKIFVDTDKGLYEELSKNINLLLTVTQAYKDIIKESAANIGQTSGQILIGKQQDIKNFVLPTKLFSSVKIDVNEQSFDGLTFISSTEKIAGTKVAQFTCGTINENAYAKVGISKSINALAKQGLSFSKLEKDKKTINEKEVPRFTLSKVNVFKGVIKSLTDCFFEITEIEKEFKTITDNIKKISDAGEPPTWKDLDQKVLSDLKAQLTFFGLFDITTHKGFEELKQMVNGFNYGYIKLAELLVKA